MKTLKIRQQGQAQKWANSLSCTGYQAWNNANNYLLLCLENICKVSIKGVFILMNRMKASFYHEHLSLVGWSSWKQVIQQSQHTYWKNSTLLVDNFQRGINLTYRSKPTANFFQSKKKQFQPETSSVLFQILFQPQKQAWAVLSNFRKVRNSAMRTSNLIQWAREAF